MGSTKRARPFVLVPVALLLLAACAAGAGRTRQVAGPEVIFEVHNDLNPARALTIRLVAQTGARSILGSVSPGQTRNLRFEDSAYHGLYRLVAEGGPWGDISSTSFSLAEGRRVIWMLQHNTIRIPDGG